MLPPPSTLAHPATPPVSEAVWFREQIQPHERSLRAYIRNRFPGLSDLDDLVQETYLRAVRAREAGQTLNKSFLFTVARNAALDLFRRSRVVSIEGLADLDSLSVSDHRPDAAASASHEQEKAILLEAIALLPDRCRQVITLRKIYDLSHEEIAQKLGIAQNTVNAQITLGMARLRDHLRSKGVTHGPRP